MTQCLHISLHLNCHCFQAYSNFKDLLAKLQNPATTGEARRFLAQLEDATESEKGKEEECMKEFNFRIHQLALSDLEGESGEK